MIEILIYLLAFTSLTIIFYNYFKPKKLLVSNLQIDDKVFLEVKVIKPATDQKVDIQSDPVAAEQLFSVLHGILREGLEDNLFSFEILVSDEKIKFIIVTPKILASHVESQIYGQYPLAQVTRISDYTQNFSNFSEFKGGSLILGKNQNIPILTFRDFEIDPLSAITSSLSQVKADEGLAIQIVINPTPDTWQIEGYDYVSRIKKKESSNKSTTSIIKMVIVGLFDLFVVNPIRMIFSLPKKEEAPKQPTITALTQAEEVLVKGIEGKLTRMGFRSYIRVLSFAKNKEECEQNYNSCMATFKQFSRANLNGFVEIQETNLPSYISDFSNRALSSNKSYILNTEELASIYHLPSASVENPNIAWAPIKLSEVPDNLPTKDCIKMGRTLYRNKTVEFGLKDGNDRLRHMYLIGKTGSGKSSLFLSMIIQDILKGNGVGVIDPHGDLIKSILEYIPDERIKDVVLVDPADYERPVGINIMELEPGDSIDRNTSEIVNSFKSIFAESWGPRLEYILRNTVNAMLSVPGTTILGIKRMLADDDYRKFILSAIDDVAIKDYFEREFAAFKQNPKLVTESISPIQNKVGPFETIKLVRNILCQKNSTIKFNEVLSSKKILLINLSKGLVGADTMNLFGSLIVSKIQAAILSRASIPEADRVPFYLYIDEFQNFTTDTFESILSESRKYKLGLYITHQYIDQLSDKIKSAVKGNVGTTVTYGLGATDANYMQELFEPYFSSTDIQSLPNFNIITTLMIDGSVSKPFNAEIIKPWEYFTKTGNAQKAIEHSRMTYGTDRALIEATVEKWIVKNFKGLKYGDIVKK